MADKTTTPVNPVNPLDVLAERLGREVAFGGSADERITRVGRDELPRAVETLTAAGARHVMFLGVDERGLDADGDLAVEEVMSLPGGPLIRLRASINPADPTHPSITPLVPAAQWDEREAYDLFGIVPAGHPDLRPLVHHKPRPGEPPPLLKLAPPVPVAALAAQREPYRSFVAHGEGVYELPVGPIHAGVIEPGHFRFSAVGESVLHLDARLFYTHRGIEKLVEGRTFEQALAIAERACGVDTVTHATVFSRAVERLTGTEVPVRAVRARVLLAELERLYNHVSDLGNMCAGVGFNPGSSRLGWAKERLLRLNEGLTGHRYLTAVVAPGGLRRDLDPAGLAAVDIGVLDIEREVRGIVRSLIRSEGFMSRLHATGIVPLARARRLGALGVAARASGDAADLRVDRPAEGYAGLAVEIASHTAGDAAARFHVRTQEVVTSARLVREIASKLAPGPVRAPLAHQAEPGASTLAGAEGPRGASWAWLMAGRDGTVERFHLRTASFANWPVVAVAVPGNLVPDFPLINKSFELCYACTDR